MTVKNYFTSIFFILGLALVSSPLRSQEDSPKFYSGADVGFGFVDEDGFFLLLLEQGFSYKPVSIRLSAPLRFRVADRNPSDSGVLREQDWDEASDFSRILRSLSVVHEWDSGFFDFYVGELNGVSIGLGAMVDSYYNSTDMDHYQGGGLFRINWAGNGFELMLDNVIDPEILAGRMFLAPISWFVDGKWARRLEIGFTAGADTNAPRRLVSQDSTVVPMALGDLSFKVVDSEAFVLLPYVQLGLMDGSPGFHGGLAASWVISEQKGLSLSIRGEYRRLSSDYHPSVFNPFYEHNRRCYPCENDSGNDDPTFADHLAETDDPPSGNGMMIDTTFEWEKGLRLGFRYDREGKDRPHWILARIEIFPKEVFSLALFYAGQDIEGGSNLFSRDALMGVALRSKVWGPINAFAEFTRRWRRVQDDMYFANETGLGVGFFAVY